jgi:hypothetical protein
MEKPDSQQRGLAGEYYVASIMSRLGYDIAITIGRAKIIDMMIRASNGKAISIQVKTTYSYNDWLAHEFNPNPNLVVALVRLGKDVHQQPEVYFLPSKKAKSLLTHKYKTHSPRINRADVRKEFQDHDFSLIMKLQES